MEIPITIIVPVYNVEKYLDQCIESILGQTFTNYQLILVDDGSTDMSGEICDRYAQVDLRIKVVHQKNGGQNAAVRTGLSIADGEYICFVDSDDTVSPEMLTVLYEKAEQFDCDIVVAEIEKINNGKATRFSPISLPAGYYDRQRIEKDIFPILFFYKNYEEIVIPGSRCSKLFKKTSLDCRAVQYNASHGEDWLLTMSTIVCASSLYLCTGEPLYYYRDNPQSITHKINMSLFDTQYGVISYCQNVICRDQKFDFNEQFEKRKIFTAIAGIKSCQRYCRKIPIKKHYDLILHILKSSSPAQKYSFDTMRTKDRIYLWLYYRKAAVVFVFMQRYLAKIKGNNCLCNYESSLYI